jgi:hypothetical protein
MLSRLVPGKIGQMEAHHESLDLRAVALNEARRASFLRRSRHRQGHWQGRCSHQKITPNALVTKKTHSALAPRAARIGMWDPPVSRGVSETDRFTFR